MASEISVSASISATKNSVTASAAATLAITMSGEDMMADTQVFPITTPEAILLGDITGAPAAIFVKNMDATNNLLLSVGASPTFCTLLPGQFTLICGPVADIRGVASASTVRAQIVAVEA